MRILLTIDGSGHSENAVNLFLGQAWPAGSVVKIVTVSPDFKAIGYGLRNLSAVAADAYQALESDITKVLQDTWQRVGDKFGASNVTTDFKVQSQSHVAEIIVQDAREWQADLIVMGAHGATGYDQGSFIDSMLHPVSGTFDARTIGSVAAGVLNHAPCSVQILNYISSASTEMQDRKNQSAVDNTRYLLAVNASDSARAVIDAVVSRPWLPETVFQILAVVEEPKSIVHSKLFKDPDIDAAHRMMYKNQKAKLEKMTAAYAEELKSKLNLSKGAVTHHVLEGNVRSCILQIAQDWGAEMIMLGAHDRDKSILEYFLGSVARAVIDNADCSVEIVRARK